MILKEHELIQITDDEKLIFRDNMTVYETGVFYYKLKDLLSKRNLYLKAINLIDSRYLYTLGSIEDITL